MNKGIYKATHIFYAFTVAFAIGLLVNALIIFLIHFLLPYPKNEDIIGMYVGSDGTTLFFITLVLAVFFYRYTKKLNLIKGV
jgi:hypothetical protein